MARRSHPGYAVVSSKPLRSGLGGCGHAISVALLMYCDSVTERYLEDLLAPRLTRFGATLSDELLEKTAALQACSRAAHG